MLQVTGVKGKKLKGIYRKIADTEKQNKKSLARLKEEIYGIDWL